VRRCSVEDGVALLVRPRTVRLWCILPAANRLDLFRRIGWEVAALDAEPEGDRENGFHIVGPASAVLLRRFVANADDKGPVEAGERRVGDRPQIIENALVVAACARGKVGERWTRPIINDQQTEGAGLRAPYGGFEGRYPGALGEKLRRTDRRLCQIDGGAGLAVVAPLLAVTIAKDLEAFDADAAGHDQPSLATIASASSSLLLLRRSSQVSRSRTS